MVMVVSTTFRRVVAYGRTGEFDGDVVRMNDFIRDRLCHYVSGSELLHRIVQTHSHIRRASSPCVPIA